jgi:hypothetical protein
MGILHNSATFNHAEALDAVGETTTVSVPGANLGDFAFASLGVSAAGMVVTAYVSAPDVVSVRLQNESAATVNLASTTVRAFVVPRDKIKHVFGPAALFATASVNVTALVDAAGATSSMTVTGAALGDYAFYSHGVDIESISAHAYVSAADTVEIRFQNESAASTDLAAAAGRVVVIPKGSLAAAFGGKVKTGAATFNQTAGADGATEIKTVTVAGAALGDYVFGSVSLDAEDQLITGYVSAADTVSFVFQNESGSTRDLGSVTLRACVIPQGFISTAATVALQK